MLQRRHIEYGIWVLFLSALSWGVFSQLTLRQRSSAYLQDAAHRFERYIADSERDFEKWLIRYRKQELNVHDFSAQLNYMRDQPLKGYWLLLKDKEAVFWNSNRISPAELRDIPLGEGLVELSNGVFYSHKFKYDDSLTACYLLGIRDRYAYENKYLRNDFLLRFDGIDDIRMLSAERAGQQVLSPKGTVLFTIALNSGQRSLLLSSHEYDSGVAFLLAIIFAVMLFFMKIDEQQVRRRPYRSLLEFVLSLTVIRLLLFIYRDKIGLQSVKLFDPEIFASHWLLPSLGDLVLHLLVIVLVIVFLFRFRWIYDKVFVSMQPKLRLLPVQFLFLLLTVLFFMVSLLISRDLVFSSNIPIGLDQFFDFNLYTYLALLLYVLFICINVATFYFLAKYVLWQMSGGRMLLLYALVLGLIWFMFSFTGEVIWLRYYGWLWVLLGMLLLFFRSRLVQRLRLFNVLLVLWSVFVAFQVNEALLRKQSEKARYLARKIFAPEDRVAVYMLLDLIPMLQQDELIRRYTSNNYEPDLNFRNRLVYQYLQGYLDRYSLYDLQFAKGNEETRGNLNAELEEQLQLNRFGLIRQFRVNARLGYSIRVPFVSDESHVDTLIVRLLQKSIKPESPFPSLLLEGDGGEAPQLGTMSFAFYENNRLIQQGGKFPYTIIDEKWRSKDGEFNLMDADDFYHFIYRPDNLNTIVVSYTAGSFFAFSAIAAALFLFSVVFIFILNRGYALLTDPENILRLSYRNRIEIALLGSVVVIMVVIGYITITYTVLKNRSNKIELIANRLQDVASAAEVVLRDQVVLSGLNDSKRLALNQAASSFATDFSIFDLQGRLVYSSQGKLFEKRLVSELMNPTAYQAIASEQKTVHIQDEQIGVFPFISAYVPLKDAKNEVVGLLNMPSFSTEQELRDDLNAYLGNLVSIYIVILLLAGLFTLWLAERITSPLQLLTQVIRRTKEGAQTRMPDWKRQDEIGVMISSYNQMLQQLEDNARLLARSERESAWREMARQIAHEIRNPLTPMKLKLQRLRRDWTENRERFDQHYVKESGLVLEQIDVLAAVASEFSSFAMVTVGEKAPFNLLNTLEQVAGLYNTQAQIDLDNRTETDQCLVFGDSQQIQRVFQNLVKNGIQAAPDERQPEITIRLYKDTTHYTVDVIDNGSGIPQEDQQKIFQPNFTTKSSGMGLGLAIVKKIVEQNDAEIGFETSFAQGTRFFVRFKIYRPEA